MSAITGIFRFHQAADAEESGRLLNTLRMFPADRTDIWREGNVFLACLTQWITPESVHERLPYYDSDRKLVIASDAILDNREELFGLLQVEYARRTGIPDSELILLAYEKWGEECPKRLIGDFAFAIWDERRRRMFGARDFSGNRTLYYFHDEERFAFCTAIRPLFSLSGVRKGINESWAAEFLAIPNMIDTLDAGSTVYEAIRQLPPSHSFLVEEERVTLSQYCTVSVEQPLRLKSDRDYEEAFREVFQRAVTANLRTHRQVGAQLSGGLDSGSVASFAARALRPEHKRLYTFSSVPADNFSDWTRSYAMADERPYIKSTIEHVGNITEHYLDFAGKDALSEVDDWLDIMEMPYKFFENSIWIKGIYEKASEYGIGVLLTGARGNFTVSWGPALDYYAVLLKKLSWLRLYREVRQYSRNAGVNPSRVMKVTAKKAFPKLHGMLPTNSSADWPTLVSLGLADRSRVFTKLKEHGFGAAGAPVPNVYEIRKKHFEQVHLWNTTGTSGCKLSLRYKLQSRDPTNDLRVVRFCLSVPIEQFVGNGLDRSLIRRSTESYLPDKVRLNQRVRGIQGADVVHRMAPSWRSFIRELEELCSDSVAAEFINVGTIRSSMSKVSGEPRPEFAFEPDFRILMRSLIFYRFLKNHL